MSEYLLKRRAMKLGLVEPKVKKPEPIKPQSDKRKELQKQYRKLVTEMLKENPLCAIHSPICTGKAEGLHHIVKRSEKNLMEKTNLLRSCNACNMYMEENDQWAREQGFVKTKFK